MQMWLEKAGQKRSCANIVTVIRKSVLVETLSGEKDLHGRFVPSKSTLDLLGKEWIAGGTGSKTRLSLLSNCTDCSLENN